MTNLKFEKFSLEHRCEVSWKQLDWTMMEGLLAFREEVQGWKEEKRKHPVAQPKTSKRQKVASKTKW